MIDLHLHLDGSLAIEDVKYLMQLNGKEEVKDLKSLLVVSPNCQSLEQYLEKFAFPLELLQTKESLSYAVKSLIQRVYDLGYIYVEIRFAPQLHQKQDLRMEEIVETVVKARDEAIQQCVNFDANIILCCMRNGSHEKNIETILVAEKFRHHIAAVDLAGPEAYKSAIEFTDLFDLAASKGLNITIHAGEATGSEEVVNAIKLLHANRIGHGVHLDLTEKNLDLVRHEDIGFEFCPTSNIQTTSIASYHACPVMAFLRDNILVTINSDNMTVSDVNVIDEYRHLIETFKMTKTEIYRLLENAIYISFTDEREKKWLRSILDDRFDAFYESLLL